MTNKFSKLTFFITTGVITVLILAGSITLSQQSSNAAEKQKTVKEISQLVGQYIKNNPRLLSKSLNSLESKSIDPNDIVTSIEELPITIGEIEFRRGLRQATGADDSVKSVFNSLVEEKLIINYAIKNNVFPTKDEINNFLKAEKSTYNKDQEARNLIDNLCASANMSLDDYWNTYEYYNAFRIVTMEKAAKHAIQTGIAKGKLKEKKNNILTEEEYTAYQNYWNTVKKELKNDVSIKINSPYNANDFMIDKARLYE